MARRTLAEIDAEVLLRLANRTDITSSQRSQFIDDAYRWVCKEYVHPEIEAETTGSLAIGADVIIPVADDIWWIEVVQNSTTGKVLDVGDKDVIEDRLKTSGDPTKWYWWSRRVRTDRKPTAITPYAIWYIKSVAELTTGQSPVIDRLFDIVIIMKAAQIGLSTVRDFKESAMLNSEIDRYVQKEGLPKREANKVMTGAGIRPRRK